MTTLEPRTNLGPGRHVFLPTQDTPRTAPVTSLAHAVQAAARALPDDALRRVAPINAGLAFHPRNVVALLSYCYARDIYSSEDVEEVMRRDAGFRQLCKQEFPDARMLRRFRRENHGALHHCLEAALRYLAEQNANGSPSHLVNDADITTETRRRLETAIFMDMP